MNRIVHFASKNVDEAGQSGQSAGEQERQDTRPRLARRPSNPAKLVESRGKTQETQPAQAHNGFQPLAGHDEMLDFRSFRLRKGAHANYSLVVSAGASLPRMLVGRGRRVSFVRLISS